MSSDESTYKGQSKNHRKKKRRKGNDGGLTPSAFSLQPLLDQLDHLDGGLFEETIGNLLPEYLHDRQVMQERVAEKDTTGQFLRPLTRSDVASFVDAAPTGSWSVSQALAIRKLKLGRERRRAGVPDVKVPTSPTEFSPLSPAPPLSAENKSTIAALEAIATTPFAHSFLARLYGVGPGTDVPGLVSVDWETVTPWMRLMGEVREHYTYAHPERERPVVVMQPITYTALQPWHLDQVHDLLGRSFWSGIDVSDSLEYSPERCTIVATHSRLVVGAAIISSPRETYITYLVVRAGWDNAQIATTMLYHLINLNPHQDITLHVSANNSAMLLYNRFGFKAEEFVAGFYDAYLDPQSRASKNAFRLRLRQH
ncbi:hypothetical protein B0H10DRAFT_2218937 [Mycena sp. CBHHK59/15]|nr:hypothetical protein B0H10DRAFT_2218937 [Mycena sp. CBHHK59/15]